MIECKGEQPWEVMWERVNSVALGYLYITPKKVLSLGLALGWLWEITSEALE